MRMLAVALALFAVPLSAANHLIDSKTFAAIAAEYSGEHAQELDRAIVRYHRIQGSPMMADVASEVVLPALKSLPVDARIEQFPSDGKTTYQSWISPMAWSIDSGELWIDGDNPVRLCRYADVPMCVSTYSKGGEWSGELVDVGPGTSDADYSGKDVRGKVALASGYAGDVVRMAVMKYGAVGTVIYPAASDRPDHPDMVRYNGLWTRADEVSRSSGSFQISANQYAMLRSMMAKGPVRVRGRIEATLGAGSLTLVHAFIRGSSPKPDEIIVTAHLDHPKWSANDNASGSAAMVEMVRTLTTLIEAKKLAPPRNTIHFIWVPEYFGTAAFLTRHPEVRPCGGAGSEPCVIADINMDMVGEDTVKTNGRFYMTRSTLAVPSFLDALLPDVLEQTREANLFAPTGTRNYWPAQMTGYAPGSDHDMFLALGVPASMFGHDPDWTHHTSEDTPDKTDASEFKRVGTLASAAAYWIAAADDAEWQRLAPAVAAEQLRADSDRLVQMRYLGDERLAAMLEKKIAAEVKPLTPAPLPARRGEGTGSANKKVIGPVSSTAFNALTGDDRRWYEAQKKTENWDLALFETLNLMDGHRTNREIADLLTIEFAEKYNEEWVNHLAGVLTTLKLVTR